MILGMILEAAMSIEPVRVGFHAFVVFLAAGFLFACERAQIADRKAELIRTLKGADVQGYLFSFNEGETQTTAALTNKAVQNVIRLGKRDTGVVLQYTRVEDNKNNTSKTYKSEITKQNGRPLRLVVTDLATNDVIEEGSFPDPGPACWGEPPGQFDSINACIDAFNCTNRGPLQCEANRTCKNQFAALTCCLTNGSSISVHLIIPPAAVSIKSCLLRSLTPELPGLVLSQD
jgi:hypothetical protein